MNETATKVNRAGLFQAYNAAKPLVRDGRLDGTRLNKALGLAQRKEPRPYRTTLHSCTCPDFAIRGRICKHVMAEQLKELAK